MLFVSNPLPLPWRYAAKMRATTEWRRLWMPPGWWRPPACHEWQILPQPWVWALPPFPPLCQGILICCPGTRQEWIKISPLLQWPEARGLCQARVMALSLWVTGRTAFTVFSSCLGPFLAVSKSPGRGPAPAPFTARLHNPLSRFFLLFCALVLSARIVKTPQ